MNNSPWMMFLKKNKVKMNLKLMMGQNLVKMKPKKCNLKANQKTKIRRKIKKRNDIIQKFDIILKNKFIYKFTIKSNF